MATDERLRRWRLILGSGGADGIGCPLSGVDVGIDAALDALYDSPRAGGLGTSSPNVARWLGERKPRLLVTDPPYGIELDSEWRDRAGLNGCGPADA